MNFSEALELLKQGKKVKRINCYGYVSIYYLEGGTLYKQDDYCTLKVGMMPAERLLDDSWEEYKEPLLTAEEKEYLKMLIKFHPNEIGSVAVCYRINYKLVCLHYKKENEYVGCKDDQSLDYDCYTARKDDFNNLENDKKYTLKELGLDEA